MAFPKVFKGGGARARMPQGGLEEASRRPQGGLKGPQGGKGTPAAAPYEILRTTNRSSEDLTRRLARGPANLKLLEAAFEKSSSERT